MIGLALASLSLLGAVLVLVGSHQAELAAALEIGLARSGALASALSFGMGVGVVAAGPLADRLPRRPLYVAAALLGTAAGGSAGALPGAAGVALSLGLLGAAVGSLQTLMNAVLAQQHGARASRALALAHLGVTLGAVLAPAAYGWIAPRFGWTGSFRALAGACAVLALAAVALRFPAPAARPAVAGATLSAGALLPLAAVALCYVGFETALTVFTVPWSAVLGLAHERGLASLSSLWAGLLAGRIALAAVRRRPDARALAAMGLGAGATLTAALAFEWTALELVLAGVGVFGGAVFPLLMALAASRAPGAEGTATGLVAGAGAIGGLSVPWVTGLVGDAAGIGGAVASLVLWCGGIAVFAAAAHARRPR